MRRMRDVRRLLAVCAAGLALSSVATDVQAQSDPNARNTAGRQLGQNRPPDLFSKNKEEKELWERIREAATPDLKYSSALAKNIATTKSLARMECYDALIKVNEQANGAGILVDGKPLGEPPNPHFITNFEQAAEVIDNLAADSPVMLACAKGAQLGRLTAIEFITALLTGVAIVPKLPVP